MIPDSEEKTELVDAMIGELSSYTKERILAILEGDPEESIRLRSSSPFTGILSENERKRIFESYRKRRYSKASID
jgi:hypothetical protein